MFDILNLANSQRRPYRREGVLCGIKIELRKMLLLSSYVTWIGVQFYRALDHYAHKSRCALQEEILG